MNAMKVIEWIASGFSIAASLVLAIWGSHDLARCIGFGGYLVANILFVYFFSRKKLYGALTMNIVFTIISIVGIIRNLP